MTRVVKIGGRAQGDPELPAAIAAAWQQQPGGLCVVHGGGDEVSTLQRALGLTPRFHDGRRVTAAEDIDVLRMALSGSANKRLVAALVGAGVQAIGLSGEDAALIGAGPIDERALGLVGAPERVNVALLWHLLDGGYLPVISPLARHRAAGAAQALNVNGDDAAAAIAVALAAEELLLVADVAGVLHEGEVVPALDVHQARRLIADGAATGGMIAKLHAALDALTGGVERVRIGDVAALHDPDRGTVLTHARSYA